VRRASDREPEKTGAPAVIVFAREPVAGAAKTRLIPYLGAATAAQFADAFIHDALAKAARLGGRRLVIAASSPRAARSSGYFSKLARRYRAQLLDQGRGDLGQRMARVLRLYAQAPGAILFGTDTPSVPDAFLRQSMIALRDAPLVLAPALDGGYYLVGVCGAVPDIFRGIEWGGARVMEQTLRRVHGLGVRYRLGRWWYDVDRAADLKFLAADLARGLCARRGGAACPATTRLLSDLGLLKLAIDAKS
jgi:rSAM/selenodomain-associated transferase 1